MLSRGSRIAVVAPSGVPDPAKLQAGISLLEEWGYLPECLPSVSAAHRYFAGTDEARLADLQFAYSGRFDAVWLARGGSGLARIVQHLRWGEMRPVPCFGFSDATTLLNALAARGLPAIHAPVLNALATLNDSATRAALRSLLAGSSTVRLSGRWLSGQGEGISAPVVGGNLCVLASLAGTPSQLDARGKIVLLEDLGEAAYKVDRLLVQCRDSGSFDGVVAFVLGDFLGAEPPKGAEWRLADVFREVLGPVPILDGLPVGHGAVNFPVPLGTRAYFENEQLVVKATRAVDRAFFPRERLRQPLVEATGVVAPSVSACVWVDGQEVFAYEADKIFDLASLTKVLCTTEVTLRLVAAGQLALDGHHPLWPRGVTTRMLLQHTAGCLWWKEFSALSPRKAIFEAALAEPLVSLPGATHTYSDLGFLCLGAAIEAIMGEPIDRIWLRWNGAEKQGFSWGNTQAAPTGEGPTGVVNDANARAMGGVAPHAGLFANARSTARLVQQWLDGQVPLAKEAFLERGVGSHALGWDTPSGAMSTAGPRPPIDAVGHTGFTGTSIWMSPARRIVAVLLTNRVAFGRDPVAIRELRRVWHQAVWDEVGTPSRSV